MKSSEGPFKQVVLGSIMNECRSLLRRSRVNPIHFLYLNIVVFGFGFVYLPIIFLVMVTR